MSDYKPQERQDLEELYRKQNVRIYELEQENKNLEKELEKNNEVSAIDFERVHKILQLKDKIERLEFDVYARHQLKLLLEGEIEKLMEENKNLKEKVETLELWLDNKEKLNEEYRDKIDLLKYQSYGPSELADSLYDANKTIEKLREEIKEIEKNQEYRYHRCMKAERQVQHSLGGDDELIYEEGLYD